MSFSFANFVIFALALGGIAYLVILHRKLIVAKKALRTARHESVELFDQSQGMCHDVLTAAQEFTTQIYTQRQEDIKQYSKALAATMQVLNEIDAARSMVFKELEGLPKDNHSSVIANKLRFIETHCQEARVILGNASFADLQSSMERLRLTHEREAQLLNRLIDKMGHH